MTGSPIPVSAGEHLASILRSGAFTVTGEIVPPRDADPGPVTAHARGLVGSLDAVNVTDNPVASAHMSAVAATALVAAAGIEPTLQLACRDRNRLALTSDLLGAWALGARNVLCLSGDPLAIGDEPNATTVDDVGVVELVAAIRRMRDEGVTSSGLELEVPPRYLIGVADVPLAEVYEPARLERKLDAGADVIWTQIVYDVEAFASWAEGARERGVAERAAVLAGVMPLRSARSARYLEDHVPGVHVPSAIVRALDDRGDDAPMAGLELAVEIVRSLASIEGVSGVHLMAMGHDDTVRAVVERAGLFPRPTGVL